MRNKKVNALILFLLLSIAICLLVIKAILNNEIPSALLPDIEIKTNVLEYDDYYEIELSLDDYEYLFDIKYAINGSLNDSNILKEYSMPIKVSKKDNVQIVPLEIAVYFKGIKYDERKTTLILDGIQELSKDRFSTYVFSITISQDELYNEQTGLFVDGPNYNGEFLTANYSQRGDEWRRDAHLDIFNSNLELVSSQNILLGVHGKASSSYPLKSLKLISKDDEMIGFCFDDCEGYKKYIIQDEYNRLILSNGGNDFPSRMNLVRYTLLSQFANYTDLLVVNTDLATVYINGNYYGLMELREDFNKKTIAQKIGSKASSIEILGDTELQCAKDGGYYELLYEDLSIEENRNKLEKIIDVDQFLMYYAFEIFCNNPDWLDNNYRVYRDNSSIDNRYKPILFDLDYSFNMILTDIDYRSESFIHNFIYEDTFFIKRIITCPEYKNRLINYLTDLNYNIFTQNNIDRIFDSTYEKIEEEMSYSENESQYEWVRFMSEHYWGNYYWLKYEFERRTDQIPNLMNEYLEVNDLYNVSFIAPSNGNAIKWNQNLLLSGNESSVYSYYQDVPMIIKPILGIGQDFYCWKINGNEVFNEEVDVSQFGKNIAVELVTKPKDEGLRIFGFSDSKKGDYIILRNYGDEPVDISNYYLSDDTENLFRFRLPNIIINPDDTKTIYCKGSEKTDEYVTNFNLKNGELLSLTNINGELIDSVEIKNTDYDNLYIRFDDSQIFKPYRNLIN